MSLSSFSIHQYIYSSSISVSLSGLDRDNSEEEQEAGEILPGYSSNGHHAPVLGISHRHSSSLDAATERDLCRGNQSLDADNSFDSTDSGASGILFIYFLSPKNIWPWLSIGVEKV